MENEAQPVTPITQPTVQTPMSVKPTSNKSNWLKIVLFSVLGLLFLTGAVYAGIQIGKNQTSNQQSVVIQPNISPTQVAVNPTGLSVTPSPTTDPTLNWKTYLDQSISFNYPSDWTKKATQLTGSGNITEFNSTDGLFTFTVSVKGNYNQVTGKPFDSIDEYLHSPDPVTYAYDSIQGNGITGKQFLPRAGSEQNSAAAFLSENKSTFYILEFDQSHDASVDKVQESQKLFSQIISTFKITSTTNNGAIGQFCAGTNNLACPPDLACKLNTINKPELGGKCVSESETNP